MENLFIEHFLSYEDFRSNKEIQALELNEEDLKAIYQVIDQNRFLLCSEHYLPILFFQHSFSYLIPTLIIAVCYLSNLLLVLII